jgi:hypothetical protein
MAHAQRIKVSGLGAEKKDELLVISQCLPLRDYTQDRCYR